VYFDGGIKASIYCILRDHRKNLRDRFGLLNTLKKHWTRQHLKFEQKLIFTSKCVRSTANFTRLTPSGNYSAVFLPNAGLGRAVSVKLIALKIMIMLKK